MAGKKKDISKRVSVTLDSSTEATLVALRAVWPGGYNLSERVRVIVEMDAEEAKKKGILEDPVPQ